MNMDRAQDSSLRPGRPEHARLAWALGISLALHLGCYGGYQLGKRLNLWQALHWPDWIRRSKVFAPPPPQPPPVLQEAPLMFVDVNPQTATAEPPKNAKFYSSKNSKAANPDANADLAMPKIEGKQTDVVKAEDTSKAKFDKLQPDFAELARQREAEQAKPKSAKAPGDLVMAKPDVTLRQDDGFTEHSRPRTIKEALMRQNRSQLVGEKMKQEGGAKRSQIVPSFDTKATPFGAYDAALIEAIQARWYDLLDQISYNNYRNGRVVIQFRLHYDGRITDMRIAESTVGDTLALLCQKAVLDPAPYEKWPQEMRQTADKDFRDISFTFYYN
ncbi:MAG: hypothetical protein U1F65_07605 [Verrucomicrobiota bacterium]